ncbi:hypothetical protein PWT90_10973 [Aphanocladium album]|nr:hypothetical protein PWT90_10973 [Aphanocladium album]
MAATTQAASIAPPDLSTLLTPILPALPPAAASSDPAPALLPFFAPILRQRVQILSSASSEPWLRLLCYDAAKAPRLAEVVTSGGALEPHPVSGEVEVDWAYDAETRFRRTDRETLQCLVVLAETGGLAFQLVHCVNDPDGGADGWRIGEVTVADKPAPFASFGGAATIAEAERLFQEKTASAAAAGGSKPSLTPGPQDVDDDDDDDGYWDRYDATPARTPANNRSPAPPSATNGGTGLSYGHAAATAAAATVDNDEDDYYAQYDDVQPAMDNHDPDEEAVAAQLNPPTTGLSPLAQQLRRESWEAVKQPVASASASATATATAHDYGSGVRDRSTSSEDRILLQHPRPESSASSNGSQTVAKLEAAAAAEAASNNGGGAMQEQSEFGVKQHVSRSIRSLFQLSRSMGIGRDEFEDMVKTELDVLGMMEE